ncbi:SAVED domain-containing protein [Colwellia sp. 6_MG-2023]|uniref:Hachiman antiphage defense system protein HamA n=1 Tax=Colwellia sp. 6_MG-2023 TaxID=3062676 RepID=UPI0026E1FA03|nr:Hachiman antiphage defense system protein HamA [Colwellia sp. 6_MG-2023]MDO6487045.1 SAVED domain-containing protein [Colwellia sp. 6_MG-2023]
MKVLMHYTTSSHVSSIFLRSGTKTFTEKERIKKVSDFYDKFHRLQNHLYFIVSYFDLGTRTPIYSVSNIHFDKKTSKFKHSKVSANTKELICEELGLNGANTYDKESYYRTFTIEGSETEFENNKKDSNLNKIKMKFFTWDELLDCNEILFNEINEKIFNKENVLKIASTYSPANKDTDDLKQKKYLDALKAIGFISKTGVNTSRTTLHGDIGEFLMHTMLSQFLSEQSSEKYIYPKLVFKTSPKMPIYGNDGTIYLKDKKEIYYLEAKFYGDLNKAINKAVVSLSEHNEVTQEELSHKIELFRNIRTDMLNEVIEIDENVSENLVLFLICDNYTGYNDILNVVKENTKLNDLKAKFNIVLFVLPIINKSDFLNLFNTKSKNVWEELNA